jgi:hypothetical protein
MPDDTEKRSGKEALRQARDAKRAAALRENLKRRKTQGEKAHAENDDKKN